LSPGVICIGACWTCSAVSVDATNITYSGSATIGDAEQHHEVRDDGEPRGGFRSSGRFSRFANRG
jgi:hypothetical protein